MITFNEWFDNSFPLKDGYYPNFSEMKEAWGASEKNTALEILEFVKERRQVASLYEKAGARAVVYMQKIERQIREKYGL